MASQKENLNALLGRDLQTEFRVSPVTDMTPVSVDLPAAQADALARQPAMPSRDSRCKARNIPIGKIRVYPC